MKNYNLKIFYERKTMKIYKIFYNTRTSFHKITIFLDTFVFVDTRDYNDRIIKRMIKLRNLFCCHGIFAVVVVFILEVVSW